MNLRLRGVPATIHGLAIRLTLAQARLTGGLKGEGGNFSEPTYWGIGMITAVVLGAAAVNTLAPDFTKALIGWAGGIIGITPPTITPPSG